MNKDNDKKKGIREKVEAAKDKIKDKAEELRKKGQEYFDDID